MAFTTDTDLSGSHATWMLPVLTCFEGPPIQLTGSKTFDSQIIINSCTQKNDVSLAKEFQEHLSKDDHKHGVID